jgi:hypothetical protein
MTFLIKNTIQGGCEFKMKLMVFSSDMAHLQQEIDNLNSIATQKNITYETYNTNSLIGMQKAVQFNVFGAFETILVDDNGKIMQRSNQQIPVFSEIQSN